MATNAGPHRAEATASFTHTPVADSAANAGAKSSAAAKASTILAQADEGPVEQARWYRDVTSERAGVRRDDQSRAATPQPTCRVLGRCGGARAPHETNETRDRMIRREEATWHEQQD